MAHQSGREFLITKILDFSLFHSSLRRHFFMTIFVKHEWTGKEKFSCLSIEAFFSHNFFSSYSSLGKINFFMLAIQLKWIENFKHVALPFKRALEKEKRKCFDCCTLYQNLILSSSISQQSIDFLMLKSNSSEIRNFSFLYAVWSSN